MEITQAEFISSHGDVAQCPPPTMPEFAFIGRSNVGKSSLINMLTNRKSLAKTSVKPGKTQTINHFLINKSWYLVDLPGYGYASVSKSKRFNWGKMIEHYILKRTTLNCLFVLIDSRLDPQSIDLDFIQWAGSKEIPLCLIFTKTDKLTKNEFHKNRAKFERALGEAWSELPDMIVTSAIKKSGKNELLDFIHAALTRK